MFLAAYCRNIYEKTTNIDDYLAVVSIRCITGE